MSRPFLATCAMRSYASGCVIMSITDSSTCTRTRTRARARARTHTHHHRRRHHHHRPASLPHSPLLPRRPSPPPPPRRPAAPPPPSSTAPCASPSCTPGAVAGARQTQRHVRRDSEAYGEMWIHELRGHDMRGSIGASMCAKDFRSAAGRRCSLAAAGPLRRPTGSPRRPRASLGVSALATCCARGCDTGDVTEGTRSGHADMTALPCGRDVTD